MTQLDPIARADEIVGLTKRNNWPQMILSGWADDIRRTQYLQWIDENHPRPSGFRFVDGLVYLADGVVAAHAAKHPQPSDGLPPGPWSVSGPSYSPSVYDATGHDICSPPSGMVNVGPWPTTARYIARCGSPAVRSILVACDDAELERWAGVIAKYKISGDCDPLICGEFRSPRGGIPTFGEITLACTVRR